MIIGLDFDGVIADAGRLKSAMGLRLFGLDIPPERFKRELVVDGGQLTDEQYTDFMDQIYNTEDIGFLMTLVEGCGRYIGKLIDEEHTIVVITSRKPVALEIARKWAKLQKLELEFVGVGTDKSKAAAARLAGCDVFVDDNFDKLVPLVGVVPHLYFFGWGYNAHIDAGVMAVRVNSWAELYEQINNL